MRYPLGFKTTISSCRSNQIASNSVCRWRGPISIYLFCSLIFMQSVTEIQLNKLRAHFRARFAPMIWANCAPLNVWGGGDYYIGANQAGKRARSLFNCISVTDGIKINEQNKSIGIGPINVIKMHHVCIAITSQRLTLSTSYFHHFILHHFSTVKCIWESWTISVPTFLRAIPPGVQNYHIFV